MPQSKDASAKGYVLSNSIGHSFIVKFRATAIIALLTAVCWVSLPHIGNWIDGWPENPFEYEFLSSCFTQVVARVLSSFLCIEKRWRWATLNNLIAQHSGRLGCWDIYSGWPPIHVCVCVCTIRGALNTSSQGLRSCSIHTRWTLPRAKTIN